MTDRSVDSGMSGDSPRPRYGGGSSRTRPGGDPATRRRVLGGIATATAAGIASAAATGLAGCLSGGTDGRDGPTLSPPTLGEADAPVTVVAYEDFACPHCKQWALGVLPALVEEFVEPGDVRYEHRDFPIPVDGRWSWAVPSAARAVQEARGDADFFAFAELAYENQGRFSYGLLRQLGERVGADGGAVEEAARLETYRPTVAADRQLGADAGVDGTPAVFVDGRATASYAYGDVAAAIRAALG